MKDEIKLWKEKTKGLFHIVEWTRFWYYITNLQEGNHNLLQEIEDIQNKNNKLIERNEKAIEYIKKHKETREHYEPYGTPMGNPNYITTHIFGYYELLNILQGEDKDE